MKSAVAVTYEVNDMLLAAEELASQICEKITFLENTCAVLLCDPDINMQALCGELNKKLSFEIVGTTAFASFEKEAGFHDICAMLLVMSADDVCFSSCLSDEITEFNAEETIQDAYHLAAQKLKCEPRLIFLFVPYTIPVLQNRYIDSLDMVSGGVPIIGGFTSIMGGSGEGLIFAGGKSCKDRFVMLLVGGNLKPVFAVSNTGDDVSGGMLQVTRSEDNRIYKIGDDTVLDFLTSRGYQESFSFYASIIPERISSMLHVREAGMDDNILLTRLLFDIDYEDGSVLTHVKIPEGSFVSMAIIKRKDVESSMKKNLNNIIEKIKNNSDGSYEYSTVICTSNFVRNVIVGHSNVPIVRSLADGIPDNLTLAGFFTKGEFAPVSLENGGLKNRVHHVSIAFCAF